MSVQVKSSGSSPTLQSRIVTPSSSTQYITPQSGYDGLSQVMVNGDSDLVSSNIKSGVNIFGVTGSYNGNIILETGTKYPFSPSIFQFDTLERSNLIIQAFSFRIDDDAWGDYQQGDICSASGTLSSRFVAQGSNSSGTLQFYSMTWSHTYSSGYEAIKVNQGPFSTGVKLNYIVVFTM